MDTLCGGHSNTKGGFYVQQSTSQKKVTLLWKCNYDSKSSFWFLCHFLKISTLNFHLHRPIHSHKVLSSSTYVSIYKGWTPDSSTSTPGHRLSSTSTGPSSFLFCIISFLLVICHGLSSDFFSLVWIYISCNHGFFLWFLICWIFQFQMMLTTVLS